MEYIISIDPGDTTGWCVLTDSGDLVATGVARSAELHNVLEGIARTYTPSRSVAERFSARTSSRRKYANLCRVISELFPDTTWVLPGTWKPSRIAILAQRPPELMSKHQFDAFRLGLWFIEGKK